MSDKLPEFKTLLRVAPLARSGTTDDLMEAATALVEAGVSEAAGGAWLTTCRRGFLFLDPDLDARTAVRLAECWREVCQAEGRPILVAAIQEVDGEKKPGFQIFQPRGYRVSSEGVEQLDSYTGRATALPVNSEELLAHLSTILAIASEHLVRDQPGFA